MNKTLIERDLRHLWHPCSQMKDYETFAPLEVKRAYGSYLELADGRKLIDATSSWWCKSLGHGHPRLKQAALEQLERFEHVMLANTTHEVIVQLSERLAQLTTQLDKVMYAGDGSCAVEIAMKMSIHARQVQGQSQRNHFLALANGYHGETMGALSVSDLGIYCDPYRPMLLDVPFIEPVPYVSGRHDPLWQDCSDIWPSIEARLAPYAQTATAILVEPIIQGAAGMKIYSQDFLRRLRTWAKQHDVHFIADEIMTGFGRTGLPLACQHAAIEPDFLCLSKGLTAGWLPFSAVLTSSAIYDLFYADYEQGKSFLHSHTYTGHALAARVALECLQVLEEEAIYQRVTERESHMLELMQAVADNTGLLHNIRGIGGVVAADLINDARLPRLGYQVFQQAVQLGALLRPLGDTIYWVPPLNVELDVLQTLQQITQQAVTLGALNGKTNNISNLGVSSS